MAKLSIKKGSEYSISDIAGFVTRGFEGYFVPIQMDEAGLLTHVRLDSIDLSESRVVLADGAPAGVALIARRGAVSRVAAMGIVPERRGQGIGKFLMEALLHDGRGRGDRRMVLEVIEQNQAAIRLYESTGFVKVRRLVGLTAEGGEAESVRELEEVDLRELGGLISAYGLADLPWQLSAETIAQYGPPYRAYRVDGAYAMTSDPELKEVRIYCLLVEPALRHQGRAVRLLQSMLSTHPGKTWHVPAIFPEEMIGPFEAAGFQRETLAQFQMSLTVVGD